MSAIALKEQTLTQGDVTVSGLMPEGAWLYVAEMPPEVIAKFVADGYEVLFAYDIKIMSGDMEFQPLPENPIAVSVATPAQDASGVEVYHVTTDARTGETAAETVTDVNAAESGAVEFSADGFSGYFGIRAIGSNDSVYYYSNGLFYHDEVCGEAEEPNVVKIDNANVTDMVTLLGHSDAYVNGALTVYMKSQYNVSGTVTFQALSPNTATIIRHNTHTNSENGALISVSSGATLTLTNITIDGARVSAYQALINNNSGGTLHIQSGAILKNSNNQAGLGSGGAVTNSGYLHIYPGSTITGNESQAGGAVRQNGGSLTMTGGTVSNNIGRTAAGMLSIAGGSPINITGGTITNNTAPGTDYGGGAISGVSPFSIGGNVEISGNTTNGNGNGINLYTSGSTAKLTLTGTPRISDQVYLGKSDNTIFADSTFIPSTPIPLIIGDWDGTDRVLVTYTSGTPNLEHFIYYTTGSVVIDEDSNSIMLKVQSGTTKASINYTGLTVGSKLTAILEN